MDYILKGGTVVLDNCAKTLDIGIKEGKIIALEENLLSDAEIIDVSNQIIFPGVIDPHVHLNEPNNEDWEGFNNGSEMLLAGGVTTYFDMPLNGNPPTISAEKFIMKEKLAKAKSVNNYRLWAGLVPGNKEELYAMHELGAIGFKAFISNSGFEPFEHVDDRTLFEGMQEVAKFGGIVALHAENDAITSALADQLIAQGKTDAASYHISRPIQAEVEAVERAISFAKITNCKLHFVHISSPQSVAIIQQAKQLGVDVTVETCPHYLLFNDQAWKTHGVHAKCAPPLRPEVIREQLVQLLAEGSFDFVASDHSPCPPHMKQEKNRGYFDVWGGINGGQFTMLSMLQFVDDQFLTLPDVARLTSANIAKRFKLKGKGEIAIGNDADFTIVEHTPFAVTQEAIQATHKNSLYEGMEFSWKISEKQREIYLRLKG